MSTASLIDGYIKERTAYESFTQKIEHLISELLQERALPYYSITSRTKDCDSLNEKIDRKQGKYKKLSEITDLCGIRIITYYSEEVDNIAKLIEQEFIVDKINTIDKRKAIDPDRFGYVSLHYVVSFNNARVKWSEYNKYKGYKAEIQIRTILQHTWAEIEHDLGYKAKETIPRDIQRDFFRLAGLLELADKEFLNIRNALDKYTEYVHSEINNQDTDILIDDISLKIFLDTNDDIIKLDSCIAENTGHAIDPTYEEYIKARVEELQWAGLKTIHDLEIALKTHFDLSLYIAEKKIEFGKYSNLTKGIGLFYLCHSIVVDEGSLPKVILFLKENHMSGNAKASAQSLISIFNEYKKNNS